MNYYIGDLHFGCVNKHEGRTLETDKLLIQNWNNVVHQNDDVYILGDIGRIGNKKENEYLCQCLSILKGKKHLIVGNHDKLKDSRIAQLFEEICDYKEIVDTTNGVQKKLVLSHYPIFTWNGAYSGTVHLYAHVHGNSDGKLYQKSLQELRKLCQQENLKGYQIKKLPYAYNVGCMNWNYTPVTVKEIMEKKEEQAESNLQEQAKTPVRKNGKNGVDLSKMETFRIIDDAIIICCDMCQSESCKQTGLSTTPDDVRRFPD